MKTGSSALVYLCLALGTLTLGFSAIFVRWADAPGSVVGFYRMGIAVAVLALPFARRARGWRGPAAPPRPAILAALAGGLFFAFDLALWASGITLSGATSPTLMANTAPLWVGLGAALLFGERQGGKFWLGMVIAMLGAMVVLGQDWQRAVQFGLGTLLGLLAAFFYGAYILATQRGRAGLDTLSYFWITAASSSVVLLGLAWLRGEALTGYPRATWLNFLALGIIVQVIGWLAINYAQGHLPASVVAPTLLGQPVLTALFAGPLLGEKFTVWHITGGIAVLAGVYLVHRSRWEAQNRTGRKEANPT